MKDELIALRDLMKTSWTHGHMALTKDGNCRCGQEEKEDAALFCLSGGTRRLKTSSATIRFINDHLHYVGSSMVNLNDERGQEAVIAFLDGLINEMD